LNFRDCKDDYLEIARSQSVNNDDLNGFMFLVLMGALCHKQGIVVDRYGTKDLRIHTMLIQPSRTGKGEALKVLGKACGYCGLRYTDETQFTDAGIVGEINSAIVQKNKQKGYAPGDPEYENPITFGDLAIYDVVSFSEGKQMIKLSAYSDDKLEILQTGMDTPGRIRKKLASEVPIEFECNTSIIATTYFLEDFEQIFLEQGIFQRMLVSVRDYTTPERRELNHILATKDPEITDADFNDKLKGFCNYLSGKVSRVPEGTRLVFDESGKQALDKRVSKWTDLIEADFVGVELSIMSGYTTSCINLYSKVAAIAAVLNGKRVVTAQEISEAHRFLRLYITSIMNEILLRMSSSDDNAVMSNILKIVKNGMTTDMKTNVIIDGVSKGKIKSKIQDEHPGVSNGKISIALSDMVKNKTIEVIRVKGEAKYIRRLDEVS
jgi:hypothetical protein